MSAFSVTKAANVEDAAAVLEFLKAQSNKLPGVLANYLRGTPEMVFQRIVAGVEVQYLVRDAGQKIVALASVVTARASGNDYARMLTFLILDDATGDTALDSLFEQVFADARGERMGKVYCSTIGTDYLLVAGLLRLGYRIEAHMRHYHGRGVDAVILSYDL